MTARPWIEAAVLLAFAPPFLPPQSPRRMRGYSYSPRTIDMPDNARFAFLRRIDATTKPVVFNDITGLARHIERQRGQQALQLEEVDHLEFKGKKALYQGVQVWTLDLAGDRDTSLGYAYLDNRGRETLEPALRNVRQTLREAA